MAIKVILSLTMLWVPCYLPFDVDDELGKEIGRENFAYTFGFGRWHPD
jgi:hypothetical protein